MNAIERVYQKKSFVVTIQESFLAILPYTILMAVGLLVVQFLEILQIKTSILEHVKYASEFLLELFSLFIFISLTYHFSKRYNVDFIVSTLLNIIIVLTLFIAFYYDELSSKNMVRDMAFWHFVIPISTTFLLRLATFKSYHSIVMKKNTGRFLNNLLFLFAVYIVSVLTYFVMVELLLYAKSMFSIAVSSEVAFLMRLFVSHVFWFIGLHGGNAMLIISDSSFLLGEIESWGLSFREFLSLFVVLGGSGAVLALIIAIFISTKDTKVRQIAKLSLPFSLFNISEVIVFGLPLVLNRAFLIPFLFVPLLNVLVAYTFLSFYTLNITESITLSWITPIFINGYFTSNGDLGVVFLQGLILALDVGFYSIFVKKYVMMQNTVLQQERLENAVGIVQKKEYTKTISNFFYEQEGVSFYQAQQEAMQASEKLENVIHLLKKNKLLMYYQPIVDIPKEEEYYEALLRLEKVDGQVLGPYFLNDIQNAGLASTIDVWVLQQVKKDLQYLEKIKPNIKVSINLHTDTLVNSEIIDYICFLFKDKSVNFEILEHNVLDSKKVQKNISKLIKSGFSIAIDDWGNGYLNYQSLSSVDVQTVKIDKTLVDNLHSQNGYTIIKHLVGLCKDLSLKCVAEGVETKEQFDALCVLGVDYIQGYYFSPAVAKEKLEVLAILKD